MSTYYANYVGIFDRGQVKIQTIIEGDCSMRMTFISQRINLFDGLSPTLKILLYLMFSTKSGSVAFLQWFLFQYLYSNIHNWVSSFNSACKNLRDFKKPLETPSICPCVYIAMFCLLDLISLFHQKVHCWPSTLSNLFISPAWLCNLLQWDFMFTNVPTFDTYVYHILINLNW